jgi:putative two-component system response regulator
METYAQDSSYPDLRADYEREIKAPFTDSLTGLYNHGFFLELLSRELLRFRRHMVPFCLSLIDIDGFDRYNREYGSVRGDWTLKEVGGVIGAQIRESDLAARYLGDRFAVLLPDTCAADAGVVAGRIKKELHERFLGSLTVCIGCVSSGEGGDRDQILRKAHEALSWAKTSGKGSIYIADAKKRPVNKEQSVVLVVDDEPVNGLLLEAMLQPLQCEAIKVTNGEEALRALAHADVDLILLDAMMPIMDGFETCRRLKENEATRMIPIVMVTALDDLASKVRAIEYGADDFITKPVNRIELGARIRALIRTKKLNEGLVSIEKVLFSLAHAVEAKDIYTEGHIKRVSTLAVDLGRMMDLPQKDIEALRIGGILHDIGKIGIPDSVLNKPGGLDAKEWEVVKTHPDVGCKVVEPLKPILKGALDVIRHHHEKLDGSGYPDGLRAGEIPTVARVMAVADIYDALVTDRPYRKGLSRVEALSIIKKQVDEGLLNGAVVSHLGALVSGTSRREGEPAA